MRDRWLALFGRDHPPALFGAADLGEGEFDSALVSFHFARDNSEIDFLDLPCLESGGEALQSLGIAGEQQAAGGVLIEPVDGNRC